MKRDVLMSLTLICLALITFIVSSCKKSQSIATSDAAAGTQGPKLKTNTGTTYYIAAGTIADHADPTIVNSIAWYFATYGTGNTYILSTSGTYYQLNEKLIVPENSIFEGNSTIASDWKLNANVGLDNQVMIQLSSGSTLQNLYIWGHRRPSEIVNMSSTNGATINNCTIFDSKNNFGSTGNPYTILINAAGTTNAMIESCVLRHAGSGPKVNPTTSQPYGYAIRLISSINSTVQNNDIASALTCGIDFTRSNTVLVTGNVIDSTGLNRLTVGPYADAITGYHNWTLNQEHFTITNNTITHAYNHGIHVSGVNINIQGNTISTHQLCGVRIDDQRDETATGGKSNEYSANITLTNNKVDNPLITGTTNRAIYVDRVDSTINLNYIINKILNGTAMPHTSTYYHDPVLFGPHTN